MITLLISSSSNIICVFKKELQKHGNFVFIVQRFTNTFQVLPLASVSVVKGVAYLAVTQKALENSFAALTRLGLPYLPPLKEPSKARRNTKKAALTRHGKEKTSELLVLYAVSSNKIQFFKKKVFLWSSCNVLQA